MTNRVVRSTKVPTADWWSLPEIRSPSQWPGTARSSTSAGRSEIMTMLGILPTWHWPRGDVGLGRAQTAGQLPTELASALDIERLVDRLVAHLHHRIVRVLEAQAPGDLLR